MHPTDVGAIVVVVNCVAIMDIIDVLGTISNRKHPLLKCIIENTFLFASNKSTILKETRETEELFIHYSISY